MKNIKVDQIFQSTDGLTPVVVDEQLFPLILERAKQQSMGSIELSINTRLLKYVAAAVVILVAVNVFSLVQFSKQEQSPAVEKVSTQLIADYNLNH